MKTIVLYYSFGGATKREATARAEKTGADLMEVRETKKRGLFRAFFPGCPDAMAQKSSVIEPLEIDWSLYDEVVLCAPVWAGFPAPAFNAALRQIPAGKIISVVLCSGGGETPKSKAGTLELIRSLGHTVRNYEDIKTGEPPKRAV